jgi:hypothetical protein
VPIWQIRRLIFDFWQALAFRPAISRLAMSFSGKVIRRKSYLLFRAARSKFASAIACSRRYRIFGEMALIDNAPRSATAIAASDAKLVPVSEKQFLFLISNTPYFALNVMRVMARRLRAANTTL